MLIFYVLVFIGIILWGYSHIKDKGYPFDNLVQDVTFTHTRNIYTDDLDGYSIFIKPGMVDRVSVYHLDKEVLIAKRSTIKWSVKWAKGTSNSTKRYIKSKMLRLELTHKWD